MEKIVFLIKEQSEIRNLKSKIELGFQGENRK